MGGCGNLINLGLHETAVRLRNACFNVPLPRGRPRNEASFGSSFLPASRFHPSPLRGEGRVRGRAERHVKSCRGVGWGEPQANPNVARRVKVRVLGFACGSPQPTPRQDLTLRSARPLTLPSPRRGEG